MNVPAFQPQLYRAVQASQPPLESLAANPHLTEREKISEVCRQFEAVLLREILRNTQKTVVASSFTDDSAASSIYRDMTTDVLADRISHSGAFGLAKSLEAELARPRSHPLTAEESTREH